MKNIFVVFMIMFCAFTACGQDNNYGNNSQDKELQNGIMFLKIGSKTLNVTLVDNSSTKRLKELLAQNPITINMSDYGGFEKVGSLGTSLPRNDVHISANYGDIILYNGNQLVIFYESNSWNYTRLGRINDISQQELKNILGIGNVTVTLSLT